MCGRIAVLIGSIIIVLAMMIAGCSGAPVIDGGETVPSSADIREGVRSPGELAREDRGGIFFVDPPVAGRAVVLFIHGINGSPRDFRFLIAHLDRSRFQPCVFFYDSGSSLAQIGRDLSGHIGELHRRYHIESLVIVGHSIGGLIARDLVLNRSLQGVDIPLLITMSVPWGGVPSAGVGVRWSPVVVDSWRDIASGSAYINSLFVDTAGSTRKLPAATRHYLLFSYRKSWSSFGLSGDAVTSVASQLSRAAQEQAYRVYGFNVSHSDILRNGGVANVLDEALRSLSPQNTKAAL